MRQIINMLLLMIEAMAFLSSCNGCGTSHHPSGPGGTAGDVPADNGLGTILDSSQIDTAHRSLGTCDPNPNGSNLMMDVKFQEADFWCWAASGEMVMEKVRPVPDIKQCDEAKREFGLNECCDSREDCDFGGWPQFNEYGFDVDTTHSQALSWEDVKAQIDCQKTPFCASWLLLRSVGSDSEGHMAVISGYKIENDIKYVYILNPLLEDSQLARWVPYPVYVSPPRYKHWDDYFNVRMANVGKH